MNSFEELYVIVRDDKEKLAFATHMSKDSGFKKRKETMVRWGGKNFTEHTYKNEFIKGFRFEKYVSRYTTSNKWFRIIDPRGFVLEISADNISDIISNTTIVKGELMDEFIWTRVDSTNYLTRKDHPDYKNSLVSTESLIGKLQIGDELKIGRTNLTYIGSKWVATVDKKTEYYDEEHDTWSQNFPYRYGRSTNPRTRKVISISRGSKIDMIFEHQEGYYREFFKTQTLKKYEITGKKNLCRNDLSQLKSVVESDYGSKTYWFFFDSKRDLTNFTMTLDEYEEMGKA